MEMLKLCIQITVRSFTPEPQTWDTWCYEVKDGLALSWSEGCAIYTRTQSGFPHFAFFSCDSIPERSSCFFHQGQTLSCLPSAVTLCTFTIEPCLENHTHLQMGLKATMKNHHPLSFGVGLTTSRINHYPH